MYAKSWPRVTRTVPGGRHARAPDHRRPPPRPAQAHAHARARHLDRELPPAPARDQPAARLRGHPRPADDHEDHRDAADRDGSPGPKGKKLALISILRAGNGLLDGVLELVPAGPRRLHRPLPRRGDAAAGPVLFQGPRRPRRARHHRPRPDARHRQLLRRRHDAAESRPAPPTSASSACSPPPKASPA